MTGLNQVTFKVPFKTKPRLSERILRAKEHLQRLKVSTSGSEATPSLLSSAHTGRGY